MRCQLVFCMLASLLLTIVAPIAWAQNPETVDLIPREKLFGNPKKAQARISPDGKYLSWLAPKDGILNVWVAPVEDLTNARALTDDKTTGIRQYFWAYTNQHILFLQDDNGDEDFHLYSVDIDSKKVVDLTPFEKIRAQVTNVSHKFPREILVGINNRGKRFFHDIYKINIISGERQLVVKNDRYAGFLADDNYNVKLSFSITPKAELQVFKADKQSEAGWSPIFKIVSEDMMTTSPMGFDSSGENVYMTDSRGRDTAALTSYNLKTGKVKQIFATDKADVNDAMIHPTKLTVQAVGYTYDRTKWEILDDSIRADLKYLGTVADGELDVVDRSHNDKTWVVAFELDNGPIKYYLYDRNKKSAKFLFSHRPELEKLPLVKMHPVVIKSRDGLNLVSYLTLPKGSDKDNNGRPDKAIPMVLLVHGGPWARDNWGYNPLHQLLANRGYAVLAVNYRGSTGFGKKFINAANLQWSKKMHDDLIDAVKWAVDEKIAIKDKVAIMGGSYGGYATLVGLTYTPDTFACGVDIVGPSSLMTLLKNPPPYWMPMMPMMKNRIGDWDTEEGRKILNDASPLNKVKNIKRPLLIAQGAKDPRVKQAESDQIVAAMKKSNIPVTYMLFPEEGHGFKRPENNQAFFAVTESFLAEHLGGRFEKIGDAFKGAKFDVPAGIGGAQGLAEAFAKQKKEK